MQFSSSINKLEKLDAMMTIRTNFIPFDRVIIDRTQELHFAETDFCFRRKSEKLRMIGTEIDLAKIAEY